MLGAGASPGISTAFLTEKLLEWRGALEPVSNPMRNLRWRISRGRPIPEWLFYRLIRFEQKFQRADQSRRPFFRWLLDVSKDVYPPPADEFGYWPAVREPNFEDLLYTVERLPYLLQTHWYDSPYKRPPPYELPFFLSSPLAKLLEEGDLLYDVLVWASSYLLDMVAQRAAAHPMTDSGALLGSLREQGILKVFTLNYDSRAVNLDEEWWTGFRPLEAAEAQERDTKAGVQVFESCPAIPEQKDAFIQLHGSTHFSWVAHAYRHAYVLCRSPQLLLDHHAPRRYGFEQWSDRTALPALALITGHRKAEKSLVEPYASYFHFLRSEAFRTPNWLIIGYGGGDFHINRTLASAADYWGNRLRAFVCTVAEPSVLSDESAYRKEISPKLALLGRAGVGARSFFSAEDSYKLTDQVFLAIDGRHASHKGAMIKHWSGLSER